MDGKLTLPEQVTLALSQQIGPQWTALASVEWKNWSRLQGLPFINSTRSAVTDLAFDYDDGWNLALGAVSWNRSIEAARRPGLRDFARARPVSHTGDT